MDDGRNTKSSTALGYTVVTITNKIISGNMETPALLEYYDWGI